MRYLQLGASLYVPAARNDLLAIGNREKYPDLRSVIFCTEDAIGAKELPRALDNLAGACRRFEPSSLLRFVRVRNPKILSLLGRMEGVDNLTGFVLPKVTRYNLEEYFTALPTTKAFQVMLTLETAEVFDPKEMGELRNLLVEENYRTRILSLRIGGNDLLQLLGMRRDRHASIYSSPLGGLIAQLVTIFRPHGFNLTGPVFEYLNRKRVLARETRKDLGMGLFGKSAIHPEQVPVIEAQYRVRPAHLHAAERILEDDARPVFRLHNAMCEPATHRTWASHIVERARLYGVRTGTHQEV